MTKKKEPKLSTNAIILILLGFIVLIILIMGFTLGWDKLFPSLDFKEIIIKKQICEEEDNPYFYNCFYNNSPAIPTMNSFAYDLDILEYTTFDGLTCYYVNKKQTICYEEEVNGVVLLQREYLKSEEFVPAICDNTCCYISLKDLSIEWLDENAECVEGCREPYEFINEERTLKFDGKSYTSYYRCELKPNSMDDGKIPEPKCSKYKYKDYTITIE